MSATQGLFIAIEGIDGSGTTTQTQLLADELRRLYPEREVLVTREPSNTSITRLIRGWLSLGDPGMSDKMLCIAFVLDRAMHIRDVVQPALDRGAIVITDRYKLSTLAYQTQKLSKPWVHDLCLEAPDPDVYVLVDVPAGESFTRVLARGTTPDRYEQRLEYQEQVSKSYHWALEVDCHVDSRVIDAGGKGVIEVHDEIVKALHPWLD